MLLTLYTSIRLYHYLTFFFLKSILIANPNKTQREIKEHFEILWKVNIGRSTICDVLKNTDKLLSMENLRPPEAKRLRSGCYPDLEN